MPLSLPTPTLYDDPRTPWRFVLSTLGGADLGEITGVNERKLSFGLNRATTLSWTMPVTHSVMATMMNQTTQHLLVKAYKRGKLMATTEIASGELRGTETGGERSIKVTCTDTAYARLEKRLIGKSTAGNTYSGDRAGLAMYMLAEANAQKDTKVRAGATSSTSVVTVGPWRYKPLLSGIAELGATLNGYDHWITPADPVGDPNGAYGYLNCTALRGARKENAVFHYGCGNFNAREYSLLWDTTNRITRALCLPSNFPDNPALLIASNSASGFAALEDTEKVGMREVLIDSDLIDYNLRLGLVNDHLAVRRLPRQVFSIQPNYTDGDGDTPDFGFDYDIGDMVEGRVLDSDLLLLDAVVRVYKADIDIEDGGMEKVTLTFVDEETTGS